MLDLYGPEFFPSPLQPVSERVHWGTKKFQEDVGHSRFRMLFAVHETEAWLLSQPNIFPDGVKQQLTKYSEQPESVNLMEPASKRIDRAYQKQFRRPYKKTVNGADLFSRLDPQQAYTKCPHLARMLDCMLELAQGDPGDPVVEGGR